MNNLSQLVLDDEQKFYLNSQGQKFCKQCYEARGQHARVSPMRVIDRADDHSITDQWIEYVCLECKYRVKG